MSTQPQINVLMLSNLYPPIVSGSSTQVNFLSKELVRQGHTVVVVTGRIDESSKEYEVVDGVTIYRLPVFRLPMLKIALNFPYLSYTFTPGNLRRIKEIIHRHQINVLHLHNHMFDMALSAVVTAIRLHIPLVLTIHTIIKHTHRIYNAILSLIDKTFLNFFVVKQANSVITPDLHTDLYMQKRFSRVGNKYIPYGIELSQGEDSLSLKTMISEKYQLQNKQVILSLGHVHDLRNRKDLVEAMPYVLEEFPDAVLLLVGAVSTSVPGDLARSLNIEKNIIFAGARPHREVFALLQIATIEAHWLNQDIPEKTSLGIASLEAMSQGKVVLAAANVNTYGKGVLRHNENVIIVEPNKPKELASTIIELLRDRDKRERIGRNAKQTIEEYFSWQKVAEKHSELYSSLIRQS
jgi:glycosyltransferase involved in cell wall biosynthesis